MKFMNMKRFGSVVMAGALALSLTAPAFATSNTSTTITGAYAEIPISVSVPTTGTASINPYGLPVTLTKADDTTVDLVSQQITTRPLDIRNNGEVALDVGVKSFLVTPSGDVSIAAAAGTNNKTIKVDLELVGLNDSKYALAADNDSLGDLLIDAFADDDTWTAADTLAAPAFANGGTAPTAADKANMAVLGASTVNDGEVTYGPKSIALFRLSGALAAEPKTGTAPNLTDDPWDTDDGFSAAIVFKFTPHQTVGASVALDNNTLNVANGGTATLTATFDAGESGLTVTKYAWSSDATGVAGVVAGNNATATSTTVTWASAGTANVTVTVTLSDNSEVSATCAVTCAS